MESKSIKLSFNLTLLTNGYMRAKLFLEGSHKRIYLLVDNKGESEVKDFLDKNRGNKKLSGIVNGFLRYFEIAGKEGTKGFTSDQVDHWKEGNEIFYEFKRGNGYRISFFHYADNKLLLATSFRKKRMKEKKQYRHAVNLKRKFDKDPRWED